MTAKLEDEIFAAWRANLATARELFASGHRAAAFSWLNRCRHARLRIREDLISYQRQHGRSWFDRGKPWRGPSRIGPVLHGVVTIAKRAKARRKR
jgi:hypothetical protein